MVARKKKINKLVTFQRSEIIYNDRPCIMLNLRDITNNDSLHSTEEKSKQTDMINFSLSCKIAEGLN